MKTRARIALQYVRTMLLDLDTGIRAPLLEDGPILMQLRQHGYDVQRTVVSLRREFPDLALRNARRILHDEPMNGRPPRIPDAVILETLARYGTDTLGAIQALRARSPRQRPMPEQRYARRQIMDRA